MTDTNEFFKLWRSHVEHIQEAEDDAVYCSNCGHALTDTVNGWRHTDGRVARSCPKPEPIDETEIGEDHLISEPAGEDDGSITAAVAQAASDSVQRLVDNGKIQKFIRSQTDRLRAYFLKRMTAYQGHADYSVYVEALEKICDELAKMKSIEKWSAAVKQLPTRILAKQQLAVEGKIRNKLRETMEISLQEQGFSSNQSASIAHGILVEGLTREEAILNEDINRRANKIAEKACDRLGVNWESDHPTTGRCFDKAVKILQKSPDLDDDEVVNLIAVVVGPRPQRTAVSIRREQDQIDQRQRWGEIKEDEFDHVAASPENAHRMGLHTEIDDLCPLCAAGNSFVIACYMSDSRGGQRTFVKKHGQVEVFQDEAAAQAKAKLMNSGPGNVSYRVEPYENLDEEYMDKPTYYCVLKNPEGDRLTWFPKNNTQEHPYDAAAREVNNSPEHKSKGPWVVVKTDRHS